MTRLTPEAVAEFREIYRQETGKQITDDEAREYAERVLRLVAVVASLGPHPPPP